LASQSTVSIKPSALALIRKAESNIHAVLKQLHANLIGQYRIRSVEIVDADFSTFERRRVLRSVNIDVEELIDEEWVESR
jgi:hypothetical protein